MNQHQKARRERYLELADKAEAERDATDRQFRELNDCMAGQPILIGHHSEGRHRRDNDRQSRRLSKIVSLDKKADYYRGKVASVGSGGVSSDDSDAIAKLAEQLAGRELKQKIMRDVNAIHKKFLKNPGALDASNMPDNYKHMTRNKGPTYSGEKHRYAFYELSNNNANIRRIRERIAELEKAATRETTETERDGIRIVENAEENRIQLFFDGKPPEETRQILKRRGFRWSRFNMAWQRHLNASGKYAAEEVLKQLAT